MSTPDRTACPAEVHGTRTAYVHHGCRCADARTAHRNYRKRYERGMLPPGTVPTFGLRRRIQALQAIGWPRKRLAELLGYSCPSRSSLSPVFWRSHIHRDLAEAIAALYEQLSMQPGPSRSARLRAERRGYLPPLAWDDIDHDHQPDPAVGEPVLVDEVAVRRAMAGGLAPDALRDEERRTAVARLARTGLSTTDIAERTGLDAARVATDRATVNARRTRTGGKP